MNTILLEGNCDQICMILAWCRSEFDLDIWPLNESADPRAWCIDSIYFGELTLLSLTFKNPDDLTLCRLRWL